MLKHTIAAALVMGTLALVSGPVEGRQNVTWRYLEQDNGPERKILRDIGRTPPELKNGDSTGDTWLKTTWLNRV